MQCKNSREYKEDVQTAELKASAGPGSLVVR